MGFKIENGVLVSYIREAAVDGLLLGYTAGGSVKQVIPDGVKEIGAGAFNWYKSLESITIPNSVTSIGFCAFNMCESLTSITIPDSVTYIGGSAFSDCVSLENVTLSKNITSIDNSTFSGCRSLKNINIPDGVTYIGTEAFYNCRSLKSITIPNSVTYIGKNAFNKCKSISIGKGFFKTAKELDESFIQQIKYTSDDIIDCILNQTWAATYIWSEAFVNAENAEKIHKKCNEILSDKDKISEEIGMNIAAFIYNYNKYLKQDDIVKTYDLLNSSELSGAVKKLMNNVTIKNIIKK